MENMKMERHIENCIAGVSKYYGAPDTVYIADPIHSRLNFAIGWLSQCEGCELVVELLETINGKGETV